VVGGAPDEGASMRKLRCSPPRRNSHDPTRVVVGVKHQLSGPDSAAVVYHLHGDMDQLLEQAEPSLYFEVERPLTEADLVLLWEADRRNVPVLCEWLMCIVIDPEFQEDRLADYQERFSGLWVPKFGQRAAIVVYVWHVLRQSRLIDWLVRIFVQLGPFV
jgi:hypothetical protein